MYDRLVAFFEPRPELSDHLYKLQETLNVLIDLREPYNDASLADIKRLQLLSGGPEPDAGDKSQAVKNSVNKLVVSSQLLKTYVYERSSDDKLNHFVTGVD